MRFPNLFRVFWLPLLICMPVTWYTGTSEIPRYFLSLAAGTTTTHWFYSFVTLHSCDRARVADAGLDWRLREAFVEGNTGAEFNKERLPAAPGRRGKKADVWRLGAIALSLTQGVLVQEHHPNIPTSLPSSFQDFLTHCLDRDERNR